MRIIGIDPGLANTGWGVIDADGARLRMLDYGVIVTSSALPTAERLRIIADAVQQRLEQFSPDTACVEQLFFAKNRTSAIAVAQSLGVILSETARRNIPVEELTPVQIKQSVTGDGRADKKAVQMMIRHILGMKKNPEPDHAADALAAAVAGSRFYTFRRRIQEGV